MKAALVYTSTTPELIELVEREVKKNLGSDVQILSYQNPDVLSLTRDAGYVTTKAAALLIDMFMQAAKDGADAILNICSSVGEAADAAQDIAKYIGVPIVRIDEEMCKDALRKGKRIGVMATLPTTLEPTKNTLKRVARELNKEIELVDCLVDGAFGLDQEQFKELMLKYSKTIADKTDVILLCQGSMAYCEELICDTVKKTVVSSPKYGAIELKKALEAKGLI